MRWWFLTIALTAIGCGSAPTEESAKAAPTAVYRLFTPTTRPTEAGMLPVNPNDAPPPVPLVYNLEVYDFLVPVDSISRNEDLWKRIDEHAIPIGPYDILQKNGIRVGELPAGDWEYLAAALEEKKGKKTVVSGVAERQIQLPVKPELPSQTIFYINRTGQLEGRTYDVSGNAFYFSFQTTPRRPGEISIDMTPVIRSKYSQLKMVADTPRDVTEERFYDLSLRLDLSLHNLLVIATSPAAKMKLTLGNAFMIEDGPSGQMERVMVIVPRAYIRVENPADGAKLPPAGPG